MSIDSDGPQPRHEKCAWFCEKYKYLFDRSLSWNVQALEFHAD
jgi:hypothetical protein